MAKGAPPYSHMAPNYAIFLIPKNEPPSLEDTKFSKPFKEFITCCLQKNPQDRLPASELLKLKFIRSAKKNSILVDLIQRKSAWDESRKKPPNFGATKRRNIDSDTESDTSLDDISDEDESQHTTKKKNGQGFWQFDSDTDSASSNNQTVRLTPSKNNANQTSLKNITPLSSSTTVTPGTGVEISSVSSVSTINNTPSTRREQSQSQDSIEFVKSDDEYDSSTLKRKTVVLRKDLQNNLEQVSPNVDTIKRGGLPNIMADLVGQTPVQTKNILEDIIIPSLKESTSKIHLNTIVDELIKVEKKDPLFSKNLLSALMSRVNTRNDSPYINSNRSSLSTTTTPERFSLAYPEGLDSSPNALLNSQKESAIGKNLMQRWKIKIKTLE